MAVPRPGRLLAASWLVLGAVSCAEAPARTRRPADAGTEDGPAAIERCRAPAGVSARPQSIAALVALVNALPRPVELTCLLESLARPLDVNAVISVVSLQPARGERSPRIFLMSGPLFMSIVPAGPGAPLVELGELVDGTRSIKGEIAFPVTEALDDAAPYRKIEMGEGTTCRFCHPSEERVAHLPDAPAYVSGALSPDERYRVRVGRLLQERDLCDDGAEPARCAFFRALLDHGEVRDRDFPASVPSIFGR